MARILVVDDEIGIRELLSEILYDEGHTVDLAENAAAARLLRAAQVHDLVLLDIWMPDTDGVSLLKEWASNGLLTMPVIMMSGHATIDTAVEATRIGAMDFLEKPITLQRLLKSVEQGLARGRGAVTRQPARPQPGVPGTLNSTVVASAGAVMQLGAAPHETTATATANEVPIFELPLDLPLREARDAFERVYFEHHLLREGGSMTRVAERTGLERTHLYRKLKQLGIELAKKKID